MKNIAFWNNQLCERGTTISLFDYAHHNESILKNKSFIFYDKTSQYNKQKVIDKFNKRFDNVIGVESFKEVDIHIKKLNISHIYIIKSGCNDGKVSKIAKNCIHCVFEANEPHGDVYATIAPNVKYNDGKYSVVPHMINLPKHSRNLRKKLNIPDNAIVFGGYGGKDQFNIEYVQEAVYEIAKLEKNIYFLFANFNKFCDELPNIIHLPTIYDVNKKVEFINTCDAMLWARKIGETFGLSIAEFSTKNKPVLCTKIGDLSHINMLGDKAILYNNKTHLKDLLLNFDPVIYPTLKTNDWNAYKDFSPEKVMEKFNQVFLNEKKCKYTYCTYFFELGDKNLSDVKDVPRKLERYLSSFEKLVKKCDKLYVWCDYKNYDKIKHLQGDNVIIIKKNISELRLFKEKDNILESLKAMSKIYNKNKFTHMFNKNNNFEAFCLYLILQNSKFDILKECKDKNPFNSEIFSWIDFGLFQHKNIVTQRWLNKEKWIPKHTDKFRISCYLYYDNWNLHESIHYQSWKDICFIYGDRKVELLGGIYTCNIKYIDHFYKLFNNMHQELLENKFIAPDQSIWTVLFKKLFMIHQDKCPPEFELVYGNYNRLLDSMVQ